ncbi:MAG: N-acetylglucosamine-6-phosphate deacetylase [Planctomycetia bacterium TMED53]|nr:MAG: N-acetylglucosamine-6-phosphate deacetylase [Planctomycetia bacterium TMED53]
MSNPEESETKVVLRDGLLVLPDRIARGDLILEGAVIRALAPAGSASGDEIWDLGGRRVIPGWIDPHIHGVGGVDFNHTDPETLAESIEGLAKQGITTVYPTIVPGPEEEMKQALATVARAAELSPSILGIHLEGPFVSPGRRGALPESGVLEWDDELMNRLLDAAAGRLRVMTFAPERVPLAAQKKFSMVGVKGSIGHTCADAEQTKAAIDAGARRCTHLCNAMPPLHHREPGPVGVLLLDHRVRCEVILDGHHLSDDLVRLALKMKGPSGLIAVSDAMPLAGMGVSSGVFCGQEVCSDGQRATLSDGTLAGSVTLLPEALSRTGNALNLDEISLQALASLNAAEDLGLPRRGSLRSDHRADLVIHGDDGIDAVLRGGLSVEDAEGPRLPASFERAL